DPNRADALLAARVKIGGQQLRDVRRTKRVQVQFWRDRQPNRFVRRVRHHCSPYGVGASVSGRFCSVTSSCTEVGFAAGGPTGAEAAGAGGGRRTGGGSSMTRLISCSTPAAARLNSRTE